MWEAMKVFGAVGLLAIALASFVGPDSRHTQQEREASWAYRFLLNLVFMPLAFFGVGACGYGWFLADEGGGRWIALGIAAFTGAAVLRFGVIPRLAGKEPWQV